MKRFLSVFLTAVMLLALATPLFPALAADDYLFSYTYSDIQVEKNSDLQRYGTNSNPITTVKDDWGGQDLPYSDAARGITGANKANTIYLAKNEREGLQVYFYEKGESRTLRLEVGEFTNANGDVLPHEVFREEYFTPEGVRFESGVDLVLADALVPCGDVVEFQTTQNQNETFYIEVRSTPDQPAGVYYADVKLYDGETALVPTKRTTKVAAVVWDFALPEQHYGNMIVGLYNSASNYGACSGFLTANGLDVYGWGTADYSGDVKNPEDRDQLNAIVEGWQEFLLDHGVNTYELPRFLIDDDEKAAELAMADVRRKNFFVPILRHDVTGSGTYDEGTLAKINQYKAVIGDNEALLKKAAFYVVDEPNLANTSATVQAKLAAAESAWPEVRRFVSYCNSNVAPEEVLRQLKPEENIICLNNSLLVGNEAYFNAYNNDFLYRWRYPGDHLYGGVELWKWAKSTVGMLRRMLFWQQHAMNEDVFLYWNCAYFNQDVWETHRLQAAGGIQTGNGNGILLYPGVPIGQPAETPIASLRLKQIASGIDDADYLALAKEFMSEEDYTLYLRKFLKNAHTEDKANQIFSSESASFPFWESYTMNAARIALGNALEAAMGEHEFGDWNVVVTPDETHYGLAIRECANCGTQESKKIGLCDQGHHIYGDWTADNADSHTRKCEVCGIPETAAHTPQTVTGSAPTCTTDGSTDSVVCADCGYVLTAAQTLPGGHSFGEWTEGEEATCVEEGTAGHYTCSVCHKDFDADGNELATLVIPRDSANHVGELTVTNAADATCTQDGYTGDTVCSACGNVTIPGAAIPATGHSWNAGTVTKEATCTGKGEKTFACANCDATKTEEIAALGHTAANKDGKCDRCGATLVNACKLCGEVHQGFPGVLIGFFHRIIYFFQNLFKK